jgi:NarL family two-component system response regulator LiaR
MRSELPDTRILLITAHEDDEHLFSVIRAGAHGCLRKEASATELVPAIRRVHAGTPLLDPAVAEKVIQELQRPARRPLTTDPLTPREVEILQLVARGLSNQAMADRLVVSERTVRTHVSNILDKLHLANRTQAALYALREGLASLDDE